MPRRVGDILDRVESVEHLVIRKDVFSSETDPFQISLQSEIHHRQKSLDGGSIQGHAGNWNDLNHHLGSAFPSDKLNRIVGVNVVLDIFEVPLESRFFGRDVGFKLGLELLRPLLPADRLHENRDVGPDSGDVFVDLLSVLRQGFVCQADHGIEDFFDFLAI